MARTAITVQSVSAFASLDDITFTAADATNDHSFVNDGRSVILIKNTDPAAKTVDIVIPSSSRTLDKTPTPTTLTAAGGGTEICFHGVLPQHIYNQSDGTVHLDVAADTGLSIAVISMAVVPK